MNYANFSYIIVETAAYQLLWTLKSFITQKKV